MSSYGGLEEPSWSSIESILIPCKMLLQKLLIFHGVLARVNITCDKYIDELALTEFDGHGHSDSGHGPSVGTIVLENRGTHGHGQACCTSVRPIPVVYIIRYIHF